MLRTRRLKQYAAAALVLTLCYSNCSGFNNGQQNTSASSVSNIWAPELEPQSTPPPAASIPNSTSQPLPATSGTKLVRQIRNGQVIATYATLGEPFTRTHSYRKVETGDIFELEPAVYVGTANQPWFGPLPLDDADYNRGSSQWLVPENITIRGVTKNGFRPVIRLDSEGASYNNLSQSMVYVDKVKNLTIENIDFDGAGYASGKAGIYLNGANGFTLRNSRVLNFRKSNGVFSTGNNSGFFLFENVETGFNGGDSGPEHNYYIGSSISDPKFVAIWRGCYSHDVYYGHLLKSRAQNNTVEGCYLRGGKSTNGIQAEAFLADFPNGGNLVFRNNILEKDYSGDNSNGIFIGYAMEGNSFPNASSIDITHNTFVARSLTYDSQGHELYPMNFYYPPKIPGDAGFPVSASIKANAFAGFKPHATYYSVNQRFRGLDFIELALNQINSNFTLMSPTQSASSAVGQLSPALPIGTKARTSSTYGALD